jgi:hypothetical protein
MDRQEAQQEAVRLVSQGWQLLPCDVPEEGAQGYYAFRVVDGKEEEQVLQWHLFGLPLKPDDAVVEAPELLDFLLNSAEVQPCDDPRKRLIGFVRYEPEQGRAVIRRTSLTRLKAMPQGDRERLMATRAVMLSAQREAQEQRIKEVAAIQGAASCA